MFSSGKLRQAWCRSIPSWDVAFPWSLQGGCITGAWEEGRGQKAGHSRSEQLLHLFWMCLARFSFNICYLLILRGVLHCIHLAANRVPEIPSSAWIRMPGPRGQKLMKAFGLIRRSPVWGRIAKLADLGPRSRFGLS